MDFDRIPPWLVAAGLAAAVVLLNLGWFAWLAIDCHLNGGSC